MTLKFFFYSTMTSKKYMISAIIYMHFIWFQSYIPISTHIQRNISMYKCTLNPFVMPQNKKVYFAFMLSFACSLSPNLWWINFLENTTASGISYQVHKEHAKEGRVTICLTHWIPITKSATIDNQEKDRTNMHRPE